MLFLKNLDDQQAIFGGKFYQICCAINVFCWITQFVGHGIYEQRAPAIITNVLFIFIAPFFDMFEVMNKAFGYREEEK